MLLVESCSSLGTEVSPVDYRKVQRVSGHGGSTGGRGCQFIYPWEPGGQKYKRCRPGKAV